MARRTKGDLAIDDQRQKQLDLLNEACDKAGVPRSVYACHGVDASEVAVEGPLLILLLRVVETAEPNEALEKLASYLEARYES